MNNVIPFPAIPLLPRSHHSLIDNVVTFPEVPFRSRLRHKAFVTRNYNDASKLFDKYRESYLVTDCKIDKQFAQHWFDIADYWGMQLDALGGAL